MRVDRERAREKRARAAFVLVRRAWDCAIERHLVVRLGVCFVWFEGGGGGWGVEWNLP